MPEFPSNEWLEALKEELNRSEAYARAAKDWEGDFYFIITPEGELQEPIYLYVDLWHGKCREAYVVDNPEEKEPAYRLKASPSVWKKVINKQLDPVQGIMSRQLQLQGNMMQIIRNVKAAQELVNCVARVPTEFPQWMGD